jgi:hypothetical protein
VEQSITFWTDSRADGHAPCGPAAQVGGFNGHVDEFVLTGLFVQTCPTSMEADVLLHRSGMLAAENGCPQDILQPDCRAC